MVQEQGLKIWLNGYLLPQEDANVSLLTHSLHYGSAVFEGIRAYSTKHGPAIFRLEEHIERLFYSAEAMYMDIPYSIEEIMEACREVIRANNLESAYIRPIIYFGDENMGLNPMANEVNVAIIAWEWGAYLPSDVKVKFSSYRRISDMTSVVDAKISGHYVNSILATLEAKKMGYDEALLLDHQGNIAEGPGENIFFINDDTIYTPYLGKILPGITRDSLIQAVRDLGYRVVERNIIPEEISSFEEAFFTGTAAEVAPISQIGTISFSQGKAESIQKYFLDIVKGEYEEFYEWLDFVGSQKL